jgi:hypothetical protein
MRVSPYVLVAFAAAESEESSIVPDEGDSLRRVAGLRAEVARLDPTCYQLSL